VHAGAPHLLERVAEERRRVNMGDRDPEAAAGRPTAVRQRDDDRLPVADDQEPVDLEP
jgi:hypothetical protein